MFIIDHRKLYTIEIVYAPRMQLRIYRIISNNINIDVPAVATTTVYVSQKRKSFSYSFCFTNSCVFTIRASSSVLKCVCGCKRRQCSGAGEAPKRLAVYLISRSITYGHCICTVTPELGEHRAPQLICAFSPKMSQTGPSSHNSGFLF